MLLFAITAYEYSLFTLVSLKYLELQSLLVTNNFFPTKLKTDFKSTEPYEAITEATIR